MKEKLLAALRGGITKVLIPQENEKDLADIPKNVKKELEIVPVSTIDEVLVHALTEIPKPLSVESKGKSESKALKGAENKDSDVIRH